MKEKAREGYLARKMSGFLVQRAFDKTFSSFNIAAEARTNVYPDIHTSGYEEDHRA